MLPPADISRFILDYYQLFFNFFRGNPFLINVIGGTAVSVGWYILVNIPFILLDSFRPKWAMKYKIQEDKLPTFDKYLASLWRILPNILLWGPLTAAVLGYFLPSSFFDPHSLPSLLSVVLQLLGFLIIEEIGFYYSHRLFHHKALYKYIHKIHHEWTAPVSITSVYCHPLEHIFSNTFPILLGPTLFGSHILVQWLWLCLALTSTTSSHSGYHFPLQPAPQFHDFHHKVFNENFGVTGWLDSFHGTDRNFRASINGKRNRYLAFGNVKTMYKEE